jgi:hypothetical protein
MKIHHLDEPTRLGSSVESRFNFDNNENGDEHPSYEHENCDEPSYHDQEPSEENKIIEIEKEAIMEKPEFWLGRRDQLSSSLMILGRMTKNFDSNEKLRAVPLYCSSFVLSMRIMNAIINEYAGFQFGFKFFYSRLIRLVISKAILRQEIAMEYKGELNNVKGTICVSSRLNFLDPEFLICLLLALPHSNFFSKFKEGDELGKISTGDLFKAAESGCTDQQTPLLLSRYSNATTVSRFNRSAHVVTLGVLNFNVPHQLLCGFIPELKIKFKREIHSQVIDESLLSVSQMRVIKREFTLRCYQAIMKRIPTETIVAYLHGKGFKEFVPMLSMIRGDMPEINSILNVVNGRCRNCGSGHLIKISNLTIDQVNSCDDMEDDLGPQKNFPKIMQVLKCLNEKKQQRGFKTLAQNTANQLGFHLSSVNVFENVRVVPGYDPFKLCSIDILHTVLGCVDHIIKIITTQILNFSIKQSDSNIYFGFFRTQWINNDASHGVLYYPSEFHGYSRELLPSFLSLVQTLVCTNSLDEAHLPLALSLLSAWIDVVLMLKKNKFRRSSLAFILQSIESE